jgi:signal transduction histidine kinase
MVDDVTRYHTLYEAAITDALPETKVHFATNGEEALERLKSPVPYDLLILDLNMPRLGGEETLRRIRRDPAFDTMPVVILTGMADPDTHRRLLELGADDFVEKGSPPEIFVARLKAQLRHKLSLDRLTRVAVDMDIFAAGVLHDIRNLETTIVTISQLAREYLATDPVGRRDVMLQDVAALEEKADGLGRYAAEVIGMVRETHKPLALAPQALPPLLEWTGRMASPLKITLAGPLAPVIADKHFLQLALLNLAQNAVKYSRAGVPPELVVTQAPGTGRVTGATLVTRLRDNGVGIKRTELRRVFEPFVRGVDQSPRGTRPTGFGLGLALVAKVTTAMGGRVWAELPEAVDGPGTVMCLELPAAAPAPAAPSTAAGGAS